MSSDNRYASGRDKYQVSQEWINIGPAQIYPRAYLAQQQAQEKRMESDEVNYSRKLDKRWTIGWNVDKEGKINMSAKKTLGTLKGSSNIDDEAQITLSVHTTEKRAPLLKLVNENSNYYFDNKPQFIEVDTGENKTSEKFPKEENEIYKRKIQNSTIFETGDFFQQEICPEFETLVQAIIANENIEKISDSVAKVQKPYNRNYRQLVN